MEKSSFPRSREVPSCFRCPISSQLMRDPVILVGSGLTFDRASIEAWLQSGKRTCPVSLKELESTDLIPNFPLRRNIQNWCRSYWPTKVLDPPHLTLIGSGENQIEENDNLFTSLRQLVQDIDVSSGNDRVWRLKTLKQMARSYAIHGKTMIDVEMISVLLRIISSHQTSKTWSTTIEVDEDDEEQDDASSSSSESCNLQRFCMRMEEYADDSYELALAILAALAQYDEVGQAIPAINPSQLSTLAWFLSKGNFNTKLSTATILKHVPVDDEAVESDFMSVIFTGLIGCLKEWGGVKKEAATLSLEAILAISSLERKSPAVVQEIRMKVAREGGIRAIVGFMPLAREVDVEKSLCLLELLCTYDEGRDAFNNYGLAMPTVLGTMDPETDTISERLARKAIDLLMLLVRYASDSRTSDSAVSHNAFMILLTLQHSDCSSDIKQRASHLLKLLYIRCTVGNSSANPDPSTPSVRRSL